MTNKDELLANPPAGGSAVPSEVRRQCGDVLLVGGTFFLNGARLVLKNGVSFPVDVHLKISRRGITFPKVHLSEAFRATYGMAHAPDGAGASKEEKS